MPKICRENVPEAVLRHLYLRLKQRQFEVDQLVMFAGWLDQGVDVPEGKWFKRFPGIIVCGEGELVTTFLLPSQLPMGKEIT
jgi:hypothetical protein